MAVHFNVEEKGRDSLSGQLYSDTRLKQEALRSKKKTSTIQPFIIEHFYHPSTNNFSKFRENVQIVIDVLLSLRSKNN